MHLLICDLAQPRSGSRAASFPLTHRAMEMILIQELLLAMQATMAEARSSSWVLRSNVPARFFEDPQQCLALAITKAQEGEYALGNHILRKVFKDKLLNICHSAKQDRVREMAVAIRTHFESREFCDRDIQQEFAKHLEGTRVDISVITWMFCEIHDQTYDIQAHGADVECAVELLNRMVIDAGTTITDVNLARIEVMLRL